MNDDAALLRRWAAGKSEAAFAELVRRHLNLVYSAALRRLGGDAHTAADVAQQVFTKLAREARKLSGHTVLTAWLYTATRNAAVDHIRAEQRRAAREQEATAMQNLFAAAPDADWARLRPVLDDVMDELSDADRTAVLLRFFEKRAFAEIGAALNLSEDAARMRVDRALDKLHGLLAKRGITSTSAALGTALARQAVTAAPSGLAASVVGAAMSEAVDTGVAAGLLAFMTATKTTIALSVVAVATTVTALYEAQHARAAGAALESGRSDVAALRRQSTEWSSRAQAEETALAEARVTAREAAERAASAQAVALEKQAADQALTRFLDADPQLQRLKRDYDLQTGIRWHLPLGLGFKLTPEELEQFAAEFNRRYSESGMNLASRDARGPMDCSSPEGLPARLASDARFMDAWQAWDARLVVENFNMTIWDPLNAAQANRLIQSIQSARPNPIPAGGWDFTGIQRTADWERVLAEVHDYLSPSQLAALRGWAAQCRRKVLLSTAAKMANP
ncbi:MAG: sigma-70 family RNA polymerase sigma factor [Verrucomicrobia bacterium]|nr:sigma-70 family RNA polymerase sigma factor [Verrucomicrobiota bacterium]